MRGVAMNCSVFNRSTAEAEFEPLYAEMNRRGTILYFHPCGSGICSPMVTEYGLNGAAGTSMEDSVIALHLIVRQIPHRFPNLKVNISHLGGLMPMLLQRLDHQLPPAIPTCLSRRALRHAASSTTPSGTARTPRCCVPGRRSGRNTWCLAATGRSCWRTKRTPRHSAISVRPGCRAKTSSRSSSVLRRLCSTCSLPRPDDQLEHTLHRVRLVDRAAVGGSIVNGQRMIAEMLHGYDVTHVFFVPTILTPAQAAMTELGITGVTTHGEKAAAYMADGYARASGRVGVCMAQTVGAANLAAGLKDAFLAGSPVLALSGGSAPNTRYRHAYQELRDDFAAFAEVTKFSGRVEIVDRLPDLLRQAFRAATTGAPGPAHLELAGEQGFVANADTTLDGIAEKRFGHVPPFRPAAEQADVAAALQALQGAERPVLVAGGGVTTSAAQAEFIALVERLGVPFVSSLNGKSGLVDSHPAVCGRCRQLLASMRQQAGRRG